jgi:hypothetical protein
MNFRTIGLVLGLVVVSLSASGADNKTIGTWKQNLTKSKYNPGPTPTVAATLVIEAAPGGEKISVNGVGADGMPASWSYTVSGDSKPTPVTGSPYGDMVSLKHVNSETTQITYTRNGKVSRTSTRTVSKDGKTLTVAAKGTDAKGQAYNNTSVFEKQ